jgi:REP element-mobilizing transposase RayT
MLCITLWQEKRFMPQKRLYVEGAIYFVTTRTFNHQKLFSQEEYCRLFLEVLDFCRRKSKFELFAFAVMPDHVHLLIRPADEYSISDIVHRVKGIFAYMYVKQQNHKGSVAESGRNKSPFDQCAGEPSWFADIRPTPPAGEPSWFADIRPTPPAGEPSWFADIRPTPSALFADIRPTPSAWFADKRRRIRINPVWQKSFYERIIRSDKQLFNTLEYIDHNAVKHQITDHPFKYLFTSIHNHYQTGKEIITIDYLD